MGEGGGIGAKGVVCIPLPPCSPQMLHNNSAVSGDVGMEEAAHLHRNGSRYEGVRSGMVSERGRVSKDEPGAFEGASAARVNRCLSKWRRFSPVSSHFCSCLISEAGFKGTRSHLCSLYRRVRRSNRCDLGEQAEGKKRIDSIMNVSLAAQGWRVKTWRKEIKRERRRRRISFK